MKVLVRSAKVIAPQSSFHHKVIDMLIENGVIVKIASSLNDFADQEVSLDNLHLSIGWFDSSVSFGEPGYEERECIENGLRTAAKSGFSTIMLNPDTFPVTDNQGAVKFLKYQSAGLATRLFPVGALTQKGEGNALAEMYDMSRAGAVAFGDYKSPVSDPNLLKIALQYTQSFGGIVQSFPLEERLSQDAVAHEGKMSMQLGLKGNPDLAEELQVYRDLALLEYVGGKLHIPTISTAKSVKRIGEAKEKGLDVSCSVAVHNLAFTEESIQGFDSRYKVNPPLRTEADRQALIEGVQTGIIDMVTSDHRPMDIEHKKMEFELAENGTLGLESAFGALNKIFGVDKTIELLTAGRERFLTENPKLAEGSPAELTFFNPKKGYTFKKEDIYSSTTNSMFLNSSLEGKVYGLYAQNHLILNEDE